MNRRGLGALLVCAGLAFGVACGGTGEGADGTFEDSTGTSEQALAPAGSNAQLISTAFPTTLAPGERRVVSVTMRNTGAASPANDWTVTPPYALSSLNSSFNWWYAYVPSTVSLGATQAFNFVITAPQTSATFQARMAAVGAGTFGDTVSVPVTVDPNATPQWGCSLVSSTLPAQLAPGETRYVTVTVRNSGSSTWPATNLKLASHDTPVNLWNVTNADLTTAVAPGATATFGFNLRAPATPGTYAFVREMKDYAGLGDFRVSNFCVNANIVVGGTSPLAAAVVSQDFATTLRPGGQQSVHVVMQNTGSETWAANGSYALYSLNTPVNQWGPTIALVKTATPNGASVSIPLFVTAPQAPGTYHQKWQMRKISGQGAGFFGAIIDVPVTVPNLAQLDAALVSHDAPAEVLINQGVTITVLMKNTGLENWSTSGYYLSSKNDPANAWGVVDTLPSAPVPGGSDGTFVIYAAAPSTPGVYHQKWQMRKATGSGAGYFGAVVDIPITVKLPEGSALNATLYSQTFPSTAYVTQTITSHVYVGNTGAETWEAGGNYVLASRNTPEDLWGQTEIALPYTVVYNNSVVFDLSLHAPSMPGSYHQTWQLKKKSGPGAGFFGPLIDVPITVSAVGAGNHLFSLNVGQCNGTAQVHVYMAEFPYQRDYSCPDASSCGYEVHPGEEFEVYCFSAGMTYDPYWNLSPSPPPGTYGRCNVDYSPPWPDTHCDVFDIQQDYTLDVGWVSNPCWPDTCL